MRRTQVFSTAADTQTSVEIHVVQGERAMAADNKSLGRFILDGLPPAPRGIPQIEVAFDVDANGILKVTARDKATNKEQSIRIEARSGLTEADIEKMRKDAEAHGSEDSKKKEEAELRNNADQLIYTSEKTLRDSGDKVSPDTRKKIEEKIAELKSARDGNKADELRKKIEDLSLMIQQAGSELYKAAGSQGAAGAGGPTSSSSQNPDTPQSDGGVRDAEFEEKKDDDESKK